MSRIVCSALFAVSCLAFVGVAQAADAPAAPVADSAKPATANLIDALRKDGHFTMFLQALEATGVDQTLREAGPYTVFAPTDDAFNALTWKDSLMKNPELLKRVVRYEIVPFGRTQSKDLTALKHAASLEGSDIFFRNVDHLMVNDASIIIADLNADNGVIHGVDRVLMPRLDPKSATAPVATSPAPVVTTIPAAETTTTTVVASNDVVEVSDSGVSGTAKSSADTMYHGLKHGSHKIKKFFWGSDD